MLLQRWVLVSMGSGRDKTWAGAGRRAPSFPRGCLSAGFLAPPVSSPEAGWVQAHEAQISLIRQRRGSLSPFAFSCFFLPVPEAAPSIRTQAQQRTGTGHGMAMEPSAREPLVRKTSFSYQTFPERAVQRLDKEYLR